MVKMLTRVAVVVLCAVLAGCAVTPRDQDGETDAPTERTPEGDLSGERDRRLEREGDVSPAVRQLVSQAEKAAMSGELDQAAVYLERAMRISPRNAVLWQNLAVVRFRQDQHAQAESLAMKSNSLTNQRELKRRNWALIAEARHSRGDGAGAREARAKAQSFQAERVGD